MLKLRKFTTISPYAFSLQKFREIDAFSLMLLFHEISRNILGESRVNSWSFHTFVGEILLNFRDSCNFAFLLEISDAAKDKFIHQMAYRCPPPELPDLEEVLKRRRNKQVNIHITPRTRQAERKTKILISNVFIYFIKNMDRAYVLE